MVGEHTHLQNAIGGINPALRNDDRSMRYFTDQLRALDKQHIWHPFTPMKLWEQADPLVIVAAEGMELIDSDGNRYLDGVSSLWCNVHGHRVPQIDQAIKSQLDKVAHSTLLGLAGDQSILLADRLMQIVPKNLKKVFYSDAGATATEVAFKMAAQYWYNISRPQKNEFVGFAEAYHGDTVSADVHRPHAGVSSALFSDALQGALSAPTTPYVYRSQTPNDPAAVREYCLASLHKILHEHGSRIAAVCIEPVVQGAGGMIVQPECFLRAVRKMTRAFGVLLNARR